MIFLDFRGFHGGVQEAAGARKFWNLWQPIGSLKKRNDAILEAELGDLSTGGLDWEILGGFD